MSQISGKPGRKSTGGVQFSNPYDQKGKKFEGYDNLKQNNDKMEKSKGKQTANSEKGELEDKYRTNL